MVEIDKENLYKLMDFSKIDKDIKNVSEKYFKYWLFESLKSKNVDSSKISYEKKTLIEDFKHGIAGMISSFWQFMYFGTDSLLDKEKQVFFASIGGYLDRIWNERYLAPLGENSLRDPQISLFLCGYFDSTNLVHFLKKNKKYFPRKSLIKKLCEKLFK